MCTACNDAVVPNGGPTWSSTGSEACVQAVILAADKLTADLAPHVKAQGSAAATWRAAIKEVHNDVGFTPAQVMLSAYGFYDGSKQDGTPVSYSAYGAGCSEVEVDVLTGERSVLRTDIVYDCGRSLNPAVDVGQVEGAFVQGLGMWTCEQVVVDEATGRLLTDSTWSYKIPTPDLIPRRMNVHFLRDAPNPVGIMSSKASGEAGLITSASVIMALQAATAAAAREMASLQLPAAAAARAAASAGPGGDFAALAPPATPRRIKHAVGSFSIAALLLDALGRQEDQGTGAHTDGGVDGGALMSAHTSSGGGGGSTSSGGGSSTSSGGGSAGDVDGGWLLVDCIEGAQQLQL